MPEPTEDFWPSDFTIQGGADPEPVVTLKEQAEILSRRTNGIVEGVVEDTLMDRGIYYSLYLRAPHLNGYMFKVLDIFIPAAHSPDSSFPVTASDTLGRFGQGEKRLQDSDHFKAWLRSVLSSNLLASVIGNLIKRSEQQVSQ